ncbi:hypothetical protein NG895_09235 [Aeoliella sp. ICT_H6.2]|uniref:Uncharacterized protein n=1 Tax=Aeoliella straminimaris TaxID=2954799 RepID=A0A9X2FDX8_9BACT|nr:hypothetical protein [Aeoliella straminimaris]MCO6044091.1 hypothetical protein [Aeoliella straminimaris]
MTARQVYVWHRYPYGPSHSCDKQLMLALDQYAKDHGGTYPAGEVSAEASLSLLYPKYADASVLCGKIVPVKVTQARLASGKLLTPETCGWHYVEGLTLSDDKRLALLWDKARLGHNGERTSDGGTAVLFVDMGYEQVTGSEWDGFLAEQAALHAARKSYVE